VHDYLRPANAGLFLSALQLSDLGIQWPIPPEMPALVPDAIHVWCAGLDLDAETMRACRAVLSPDEQARAARFVFERDRTRFVAARGTLRFLLGQYVNCAPQDLAFVYGAQGKPALPDSGGLAFNLSHSQGLGVWAFGCDRALGVDV